MIPHIFGILSDPIPTECLSNHIDVNLGCPHGFLVAFKTVDTICLFLTTCKMDAMSLLGKTLWKKLRKPFLLAKQHKTLTENRLF